MSNSRSVEAMIEFYHIRMNGTENLAEFLARYHRVWLDIREANISGLVGIFRLIPLLPDEWQGWAASLAPRFITPRYWDGELYGDCCGFIAEICSRFMCYSFPPPGPYPHAIPVEEPGFEDPLFQHDPIPQENPEPVHSPNHENNDVDVNSSISQPLEDGHVSSPSPSENVDFVPDSSVLPNGVASGSFVEEVPTNPNFNVSQTLNSPELEPYFGTQNIPSVHCEGSSSGPRHFDSDEDNVDPEVGPTEGYFHLRRIPFHLLTFQPSFRPSPGTDITNTPRVTLSGVERSEWSSESEEDPSDEEPIKDEEEENPSEDEK